MPPVVAIVGRSGSGKTTLMEKLLAELKSRGYRVATAKHVHQHLVFDQPGKDSWRHIQSGSESTTIIAPGQMITIQPLAETPGLDELVRRIGDDYDLILVEGFRQGDAPKIEVHRREVAPPLPDLKRLVAIATDEPLETKVRQFSLEDAEGLADLLEEGFIQPQKERISLYVNGKPVVLTLFPRQIISNILVAMASSLKGVGEIRDIEISLKRNPAEQDAGKESV